MVQLTDTQKFIIRGACSNFGALVTAAVVKQALGNLSDMPDDWVDKMAIIFATGIGGSSAGNAIATFAIEGYKRLTDNPDKDKVE